MPLVIIMIRESRNLDNGTTTVPEHLQMTEGEAASFFFPCHGKLDPLPLRKYPQLCIRFPGLSRKFEPLSRQFHPVIHPRIGE